MFYFQQRQVLKGSIGNRLENAHNISWFHLFLLGRLFSNLLSWSCTWSLLTRLGGYFETRYRGVAHDDLCSLAWAVILKLFIMELHMISVSLCCLHGDARSLAWAVILKSFIRDLKLLASAARRIIWFHSLSRLGSYFETFYHGGAERYLC